MKHVRAIGLAGSLLLGCAQRPSAESPAPPPPATPESAPAPSAESAPHPSGKRAPCTFGQDQTCNADPKVSALWGKCLETGVCECQPGFELNPMGSCAPVK